MCGREHTLFWPGERSDRWDTQDEERVIMLHRGCEDNTAWQPRSARSKCAIMIACSNLLSCMTFLMLASLREKCIIWKMCLLLIDFWWNTTIMRFKMTWDRSRAHPLLGKDENNSPNVQYYLKESTKSWQKANQGGEERQTGGLHAAHVSWALL